MKKISECLGVVTKWQVLFEETVTSSEENQAGNAFLPPVTSCYSTAVDTELLSDELTQITANSDVVHLMAVEIFPSSFEHILHCFSFFSWFLGIEAIFCFKFFYTVRLCYKKLSTCTKEGREIIVSNNSWLPPSPPQELSAYQRSISSHMKECRVFKKIRLQKHFRII